MSTKALLAALALATAGGLIGCCDAEEQHAVTVSAPGLLTVTRDGATRQIESVIRATDPPIPTANFQFVFNTLEGNTVGDGFALSLSGNDPVSDELITLAVALPMTLRDGDQVPVGTTFRIEPGIDDQRLFGAYDLQDPTKAETSLTISTYTFPPGTYTPTFQASATTGTIQVVERERGRLALMLNLTFTDPAGKTVNVAGKMQAVTERYTPPCFS